MYNKNKSNKIKTEDGDDAGDGNTGADDGADSACKRARFDPDFDAVTERSKAKDVLQKLLPPQIKECETALKEGEASYNTLKNNTS